LFFSDDLSHKDRLAKISGDGTAVLTHEANRGYGASLKTGIRSARYDNVFIVDSDGTYPLKRLREMMGMLLDNRCDMVVGARVGKGAKIPAIRRPAKWLIQSLARYLTGEKIPDLNSGFRGVKKDILQRFFNILPDGFSFTTTITLAMLTNGYKVEYIPIDYNKRVGRSKISPIRDTINFVQLICRTVLYFNPLKIFLPLSLFLFMSGVAVLVLSYLFTERVMDVTTVVIIMAAFQVLAIGLIADLIDKRMK